MNIGSLIPWRDSKPSTPDVRSEALDPFVSFRREFDRMFDDFFTGFGRSLSTRTNAWQGVVPTIDLSENDKEVVVTAELPGLDDFEVTVSGDLLTLKGEKKSEHTQQNGDATYTERRFGSFARSVRLPFEVAPLFREWLDTHFPDRAAKVMSQIHDMRGGRDNDPDFGSRMRGQGAYAALIRARFEKAKRRLGLAGGRIELRKDLFVPPSDQSRLF